MGKIHYRVDVLGEPLFWKFLLPIVFVAILETLISAKIADQKTGDRCNNKNEMKALSYSNIAAGLLGGLPVTAALARTTLNISEGGKHKTSALLNGLIMIVIGLLIFEFFKYLPMPMVAAQVNIVAINMVNTHFLKFVWKHDSESFYL
jgi:SulP family sulfate permease